MDIQNIGAFSLAGLSGINVILGKNGCGKSYLLKELDQHIRGKPNFANVRYISPERGGSLQYEAGVEQQITNDPNWMGNVRRRNQSENFRQQSTALFRRLELLVLREIERDHTKDGYKPRTFQDTIESLNTLLERVRLERDKLKAFRIVELEKSEEQSPAQLSSGETELISLGIEFLSFVKECGQDQAQTGNVNLLLVDEPDVHLHPDLQHRLARFIIATLRGANVTLITATHSTALVAGLAEEPSARIAFMRRKDRVLNFKVMSDVDRKILPIFGAHPLSNVFNEAPCLLVEGDDDERIWQQAVRSSGGKIRLHPCVVDSIDRFSEFEKEVDALIGSIYDSAIGFSLRDRDSMPEDISDMGRVVRMRLT